MAVISIEYSEGNKKDLGYKSVQISYNMLKEKKEFSSGNFIKDWYNLMKFIIENKLWSKEPISDSSSVDHFIMDGAPYSSAYLHMENDNPVLKYTEEINEEELKTFLREKYKTKKQRKDAERRIRLNKILSEKDITDGVEFFVPENTKPTLDELKEMCK